MRIVHFVSIVAALVTSGCATYADRLNEVRSLYVVNDLAGAEKNLETGLRRRCDRDVLKLDRAMLLLSSGKPREAERQLREVRDEFDRLQSKAYGEKALSMLTDSQAEAYKGEDYEQVLIRAFLCLSNLMSDGGDAVAYALQTAEKQQQIIDAAVEKDGTNPKQDYPRVAMGAYLHGAVREASHANYDDVERAATVVCSWQPDFPYGPQDLDRARQGRHSSDGCGVLYAVTLVGVGPHKEEVVELPSTVSLLIADQLFSAFGNQTLPPNIAPVKVPQLVRTQHEVDCVALSVDGSAAGRTATITDVGSLALKQYDTVYPRIVAEAVVRRIVKKGVVYGAKELIGTEKHSLPALALDLVGIAWEASESADTRCWGLLPDKIQVLRLEVPAGRHAVGLQSLNAGGYPLGRPVQHEIEIVDGRNTYLLANFPYGNLVGTVQTNTP